MPETAYEKAGVNISEGERFAELIAKETAIHWPEAADEIGGFAGGGPIPAGASKLNGSVDGVGTKLKIAFMLDQHGTVGIDAMAMAGVDKYMSGTRPLYAWDYLSLSALDPDKHIDIIRGLITGCLRCGARLVGGETAEMPGFYKPGEYDMAVFCVGFDDPELELRPTENIKPGMQVVGWASNGAGSNGYSLLRKVWRITGERPSRIMPRLMKYHPQLGCTLGEALLRPTEIHINAIEKAKENGVKFVGHSHNTGGGLPGNIPRILPDGCKVVLDRSKWELPAIFPMTQEKGGIDPDEMYQVFNMGLQVVSVIEEGQITDPNCVVVGEVQKRKDEKQVEFKGSF